MRLVFLAVGVSLMGAVALAEGPTLSKAPEDESTPKTEQETQCEIGNSEACCQAGTYFQFLAPVLSPYRASALQERGCKLGAKACCDALELQRRGIAHVYEVNVPHTILPAPIGLGEPGASESSPPSREEQECAFVHCNGKECGCALRKEGWKELARCPGHEWRYVLEKDGKRVLCYGISALGGPREDPCTPFAGDIEKFKSCSEERPK